MTLPRTRSYQLKYTREEPGLYGEPETSYWKSNSELNVKTSPKNATPKDPVGTRRPLKVNYI